MKQKCNVYTVKMYNVGKDKKIKRIKGYIGTSLTVTKLQELKQK